ncbi:16980_t:CDS:1, partial [Funneliformis geosporum]
MDNEFEYDLDLNDISPDESASTIRSSSRISGGSSGSAVRPLLNSRVGPKLSSTVWNFFDKNTVEHPGVPVCQNCKAVFESSSSTSSLRRHLNSHQIVAPKRQRFITEYRIDPHTTRDQQERDDAIIKWIICDQQPFTVVECPEWREMILKFDQRYRFHNRQTTKDQIISLFEKKKIDIKELIAKIPGKVSFTSDMWTASNGHAFLSLTIHYIDSDWQLKNFLLDIIPFSIRHTGINMADAIMNVLYEY